MSKEIQTFLFAMTPLFELRGAIPFAILVQKMTPFSAYFISVLGNIVPIFFIVTFLKPVSLWLSEKFLFMKRFFEYLFSKTRKNHSERIKKYGPFALFLFTAIPLPLTGAWTASLIAVLFGLSFFQSITSIGGGVALAGLFVVFIVEGGVAIEKFYGSQVLAGVLLLVLFLYFIYYQNNKKLK